MKSFQNILKRLNRSKYIIVVLFLACTFYTCRTKPSSFKSRSIGAPGELLIVIDHSLQSSEIKETLNNFAGEEFPCIPQPEATFKVTSITPHDFEGHFKAYRNIIILQQNFHLPAQLRYSSDIWASNQQVAEIRFSNEASFNQLFEENKSQLHDFLYYGDISTMSKANAKGADAATRKFIHDKYNLDMTLPQGFRLVKDTLGFCWFRHDRLETMQSIAINTFSLDSIPSLAIDDLVSLQDLVGSAYVPGPSENTFMTTESRMPVQFKRIFKNDLDIIELRGLWKVQGYFMGGPFVNFFIIDEKSNQLILIEGFVHAPTKQNKAYYVRQIESILYSVKKV